MRAYHPWHWVPASCRDDGTREASKRHLGHLVVGEQGVEGHAFALGDLLAQAAQSRVEGEVGLAEDVAVVDLAALGRCGTAVSGRLVADADGPDAGTAILR
jgi:hypothetical protein